MAKLLNNFVNNTRGNMTTISAVLAVPLLVAVGVSVDYGTSTTTRSNMQNALDIGTMSVINMSKTTTLPQRQTRLQDIYLANGGTGSATITAFNITASGSADITTAAQYQQPTTFMRLAGRNDVALGVTSQTHKEPVLIEAKFEIVAASGWWDKTMSLYGTKIGETTAKKLLDITYAYNRAGEAKGYGTMTVNTVAANGALTTIQQQVCKTETVSSFLGLLIGTITSTYNGLKKATTCTTTGSAATVDVQDMDTLYLQMDVPKNSSTYPNNPSKAIKLRSDDPTTSNRLYIDGVEVETGQTVDIFSAVPCGQTSQQAWEDGGNAVPAPVSNADFFYKVTGKCDFSTRPVGVVMTE